MNVLSIKIFQGVPYEFKYGFITYVGVCGVCTTRPYLQRFSEMTKEDGEFRVLVTWKTDGVERVIAGRFLTFGWWRGYVERDVGIHWIYDLDGVNQIRTHGNDTAYR